MLIELQKSVCLKSELQHMNISLEDKEVDKLVNCGIHMGWSIEGAIGSRHKIDVSYLSPNVNLAS